MIENDDLVIVPKREFERLTRISEMISEDQLWFWTKEWQDKEKEADDDIRENCTSTEILNNSNCLSNKR